MAFRSTYVLHNRVGIHYSLLVFMQQQMQILLIRTRPLNKVRRQEVHCGKESADICITGSSLFKKQTILVWMFQVQPTDWGKGQFAEC